MKPDTIILGIAMMAFAFFAVLYISTIFKFGHVMPGSVAAAVAVGVFYFLAAYQGLGR